MHPPADGGVHQTVVRDDPRTARQIIPPDLAVAETRGVGVDGEGDRRNTSADQGFAGPERRTDCHVGIAPGDALVRYTIYGDADLNGVVNFDDYARTDNGFLNNRTGWVNGDYDYNNLINFDDYSLIDLAFNV